MDWCIVGSNVVCRGSTWTDCPKKLRCHEDSCHVCVLGGWGGGGHRASWRAVRVRKSVSMFVIDTHEEVSLLCFFSSSVLIGIGQL